jgi:hypothetical protein
MAQRDTLMGIAARYKPAHNDQSFGSVAFVQ